ncbi:aromatic acid exporter family protein [Microbacterium sp. APC 3898]|uniref:Aromatic acid exporter family protein n=1 Tax=Planococcus notacanthi TaxID=3035188 RepID=A0ABT7ZNX2_9BACL|nr:MULTISPECIES: aromatic acid exporter family protein [Terrabacteria group]MDN3428872.1 aromatic acid exporter family protein [Planococcus sp. APC 4016]MDN3439984.1 aromatic acid exporter family protein [Planococcus sp. APC 3900]MDN3500686.1 aromatic acid exporter family protein [Microbacterium sp. APC 3898]
MKLGARILKTGVAISMALFLASLLELPSPVFAGVAAIFAIQPSIYRSYLTLLDQIYGNLIGAAIAITFVLTMGSNYLTIGAAAILAIVLLLKLKLENTVSLTLVTIIIIMDSHSADFMTFASLRFGTVLLGILSAFFVNLIFLPPKYETRLFTSIHEVSEEVIRWIRVSIRHASDHVSVKEDIDKLTEKLVKVDQWYSFYKEERSYTKKQQYVKARKLVLYRQMIATSKKSLEVLKRLNRFENEMMELPEHFHMMVQERLESLASYHEQLYMKYVGKMRPEHSEGSGAEAIMKRNEVMTIFVKEINLAHEENEDEFSVYHLMHVLSAILDYEEQLEHLDLLIIAYLNYHSEEVDSDLENAI